MRFISMRSDPGEAPVLFADLVPGESPEEKAKVEGGTGVVVMVAPSSVDTNGRQIPARAAIRAVDVVVESEAGPESHGYVLARRARRGALVVMSKAHQPRDPAIVGPPNTRAEEYLALRLDPPAPAPEPAKEG